MTPRACDVRSTSDSAIRGQCRSNRWSRRKKAFPIETPAFPGETLGQLTVTRHTNVARDREMLFFELTWSPIC